MRMKKMRLKIAAALLVAALSTLAAGSASAAEASSSTVRYLCEPRQNFVVTRAEDTAIVQFVGRRYELRRGSSSIGRKYLSDKAALIIDGKSAVFVAEDRFQLGTCVEATHFASN